MLLGSLGVGPRLRGSAPKFTRTLVNKTALRPVPKLHVFPAKAPSPVNPEPTPLPITTPQQFLSAIGRSCEAKLEPESWDALWKTSGHDMQKAGLAVKDRKYVVYLLLDPLSY
jgi:hypothetical protein